MNIYLKCAEMCFKEGVIAPSGLLISWPQAESGGIQGRVETVRGKIVAPAATQTLFSGEASDGDGVKGAGGGQRR